MQRADVVHGRDVARSYEVIIVALVQVGVGRVATLRLGLWTEVVQSVKACDDTGECRRNRCRGDVGEVSLAIRRKTMDLSLECSFDEGGRAAENHKVAPASRTHNRESLRLKPGRDLIQVIVAEAEPVRILLRCEPLAKRSRVRILLTEIKSVQLFLLSRRGGCQQSDVAHRQRRVDASLICRMARLQRHGTADFHRLAGNDRTTDSVWRCGKAHARQNHKAEDGERKSGRGQARRRRTSHGLLRGTSEVVRGTRSIIPASPCLIKLFFAGLYECQNLVNSCDLRHFTSDDRVLERSNH